MLRAWAEFQPHQAIDTENIEKGRPIRNPPGGFLRVKEHGGGRLYVDARADPSAEAAFGMTAGGAADPSAALRINRRSHSQALARRKAESSGRKIFWLGPGQRARARFFFKEQAVEKLPLAYSA
jgi:hypothetical protein